MLDGLFDWIAAFFSRAWAILTLRGFRRRARGSSRGKIALGVAATFLVLMLVWWGHFFWHALWIRGYDLAYPQAAISAARSANVPEQLAPEGGTQETRARAPSHLVEVQVALVDFLVEENAWVPALPQYKSGLLWLTDWEKTPWLDDKASFQIGVLKAVRRTAVELTDILGRERGTSALDEDLREARGALQFDEKTWYLNPFEARRPFGPTTASADFFRRSIPAYRTYNDRLTRGRALFDARADNLQQMLDRTAKDLGSMSETLAKRSQGTEYDPRSDTFRDGSGNDRGLFDFRADNLFREASGMAYAYHGLLQGLREDFSRVIDLRDVSDVWDRLEIHMASAAALSPLAVSNGAEDGMLVPDHLAVMTERLLRARANLIEIRDVLAR